MSVRQNCFNSATISTINKGGDRFEYFILRVNKEAKQVDSIKHRIVKIYAFNILIGKPTGKIPLGRP